MTDPTGLGSAGLLIYLIVKEALAITNRKRNGKQSGQMDPAEWKLIMSNIVRDEVQRLLDARPGPEYLEKIEAELGKIRDLIYERR